MPSVTQKNPAKRVLTEAAHTRTNLQDSPRSAKKLKLDDATTTNGRPTKVVNGGFNSSQAKSSFETDVLEKFSQDMSTLKENNTERDQPWERPGLDNFNPTKDNICFQQIEAEEGAIHGGKPAIKLFGVTEVNTACIIDEYFN
jgi:DNA polymerase delta subunit 1